MSEIREKMLLTVLFSGLFLAAAAHAQTATTGQLLGEIRDPSGSLVPHAKVVAIGEEGTQREIETSDAGLYLIPLVPPGSYRLVINAPGFAPEQLDGVLVRITEATRTDVSLRIAVREEVVNVTGAPPLLQTESGVRGTVIEQLPINQLPLPTRNFQQLLTLTPGTSGALQNSSDLGRGDAVVNVNGQRSLSNNVVINGMDANSIGTGSTPNLAVPALDSLQEFIVQTSGYDAAQGRNTGGAMSVVTKSGTNLFHGNLYEFLRNTVFDANNFFLNRENVGRPKYNRNQFGATFGGPVVKNRAWFFASYQGTREINGTSLQNSLATVFIPGNLGPQRDAAALARFAASEGVPGSIAPTALAVLQAKLPNGQFMMPSAPGATTGVGSTVPVPVTLPSNSRFNEDQFNANLDLKLSSANHFSGKFFFANNQTNQALYNSYGDGNAIQSPGWPVKQVIDHRLLSTALTSVLSQTLVNEVSFGWSTIQGPSIPDEPVAASSLGISSPLSSLFAGMPTLTFPNMFDLGTSQLADNYAEVTTYSAGDVIMWTHERHTTRFGGSYSRSFVNANFNAYTRGQVFFLGLINGNPFTDFLSGLSSLSLIGSGVAKLQNRANAFNLFLQDDWKISPRLTLNLGVRYDYFGPVSEADGRQVAFVPSIATTAAIPGGVAVTGGFVQAANGNLPGIGKTAAGLVGSNYANLGPRLGFAYRPLTSNRFVVRGGYGLYFDRPNMRLYNAQLFNEPYYMLATVFGTPLNSPFVQVPLPSAFPLNFSSRTLFPFGGPPAVLPAAVQGGVTVVPATGTYPDSNQWYTSYVHQYNLGLQWEFRPDWMLDVAYVGSLGRDFPRLYSLNQAPTPALAGFSGGAYFPGLSNLPAPVLGTFAVRTDSSSSYNSLQVSLNKRFSKGLQVLTSYTYSHSLDDYSASDVSDITAIPGNMVKLDNHASSDFDRRQRFVLSAIYDLPKLYRGHSETISRVVNGWQVSGILVTQTGVPFSVLGSDTAFAATRANYVAGRTIPSIIRDGPVTSRLNAYFDTSAFVAPTAFGDFGTTGRNILRAPEQSNVDFSLIKFFSIAEKRDLEFRAEFFNIFNIANFAAPVNVVNSANFGEVVATATGPRVIQFALKYRF
jgi:hypothetical protein